MSKQKIKVGCGEDPTITVNSPKVVVSEGYRQKEREGQKVEKEL